MGKKNEVVKSARKNIKPVKLGTKMNSPKKGTIQKQNGVGAKPSAKNISKLKSKSSSSSASSSPKSNAKATIKIKKPPTLKQPISKPKPKEKSRLSPVKKVQPKPANKPSFQLNANAKSAKSKSGNESVAVAVASTARRPIEAEKPIGAKTPLDKSQINVGRDVRINGLSSLFNTAQKATPKLKQLLFNECDIIMECRFCRNLFRSLPNFISHKQNYCKNLFHPASDGGCSQFLQNRPPAVEYDHFVSATTTATAESSLQSPSLTTTTDIAESVNNIEDSETKSALSFLTDIEDLNDSDNMTKTEKVNMLLEPVGSRKETIVYQRRMDGDPSTCDLKDNFHDSREVMDRDTAILGPDGKVICTGTARGIEKIVRHLTAQIDLSHRRMVQNSTNQFQEMCDICKTVFNTEKALRQHRRDAPDCVRQSTNKPFNDNDYGNQNSLSVKRSSFSAFGNGSFKGPNNTNFATPSKQLKQARDNEGQQNAEKLIRELFPSPCKSPMKKSSLKLSPYKKTIGKAVKHLQSNSWAPKSVTATSEFPFACIKCSSTFRTTGEMSLHLATMCSDNAKLFSSKNSNSNSNGIKSSLEERIGIEVRQMYSKQESTDDTGDGDKDKDQVDTGMEKLQPGTDNTIIANGDAEANASTNLGDNEENGITKNEKSTHDSDLSVDTFEVVAADHDYESARLGHVLMQQEQDDEGHNITASAKPEAKHETNNNEAIEMPVDATAFTTQMSTSKTDDMGTDIQNLFHSTSIESDGDRDQETVSNNTDSGVSSTSTTIGEEGGLPGLPFSELLMSDNEMQQSVNVPNLVKELTLPNLNSRPKRNTKPEDRVLTPKNKNLKPSNDSQRRTSFRTRKTPVALLATQTQTAPKRKT